MSQYDGTGEKQRDGGDSGAFKGRRHPFLDRSIDWKEIDKAKARGGSELYGSETAGDSGISDKTALPREVDFEIIGDYDPSSLRIQACVAAVKKLHADSGKWSVIHDCLTKEYRSAGSHADRAELGLIGFVDAVNRRLGKAGKLEVKKLTGEKAEQVAQAERVVNPPLTLSVRVRHAHGFFGPKGVSFTPPGET
jgi:hypothetical protein